MNERRICCERYGAKSRLVEKHRPGAEEAAAPVGLAGGQPAEAEVESVDHCFERIDDGQWERSLLGLLHAPCFPSSAAVPRSRRG